MQLEVLHADDKPQALMRHATDVAGVCRQIVMQTACNIQGRQYVKCEGWMAIATAHGCIASSRDVQRVDGSPNAPGGWTAIGEVRRMSDGVLLAQAEGFVGKDEKKWGSCPEYACRAMVQTRAISRACRAAFAHVVVLIDANLSTTPAEEVPEGGFENAPRRATKAVSSPPASQDDPTPPPERKTAPSAPGGTEDALVGVVEAVSSKPGTKKNGDTYTKYGVKVAGQWMSHFSATNHALAEAAKAEGLEVRCRYTEGKFGKDLLDIRDANAVAQPADPATGGDDVPF
jgi:hypothetical protein